MLIFSFYTHASEHHSSPASLCVHSIQCTVLVTPLVRIIKIPEYYIDLCRNCLLINILFIFYCILQLWYKIVQHCSNIYAQYRYF